MSLNPAQARHFLQSFNFTALFVEELGWSNPAIRKAVALKADGHALTRTPVAELARAIVFEIQTEDGTIPPREIREAASKAVLGLHHEHILIFTDRERSQCVWRWLRKQDNKYLPREHVFMRGQSGDAFIAKLAALFVDISEIEQDITIVDVARKMKAALDVEPVTRRFYAEYQQQFVAFVEHIDGIDRDEDRRWYASVLLNRLMFIYFLQKKLFLDGGKENYLSQKLAASKEQGPDQFYAVFLKDLFFTGFALPETDRPQATRDRIGQIPYLNGGLFLPHLIEQKYPRIAIPDVAFDNLMALFDRYNWSLNDLPDKPDNEINPDVLGYIFEKYINQKAFGAYYTRPEITEYLCEQTVYKLVLDAINGPEVEPALLKKAGLGAPRRYESIEDLLLRMDAPTCASLVMGPTAILPTITLLDPACGSGAFLVAAMKTLINVYAAVLGKIEFLADAKLAAWKQQIVRDHPSLNYYIKKQIITGNLYGVDIMEEATEIAKLRLFLALIASAQTADQLEPLPNIDFNIMSGNSLVGLMRVNEDLFNTRHKVLKPAPPSGKVVQDANLFRPALVQGGLFSENKAKSYHQLIQEKEAAINSYRHAHERGLTADDLRQLRDRIREQERAANDILHNLLLDEFTTLDIKYEEMTWDKDKNKPAKPKKRALALKDIEALEPFHWGYEFSEIFRARNGFDAIITNPPWEIFKPQAKEFFAQHSEVVTKNKMNIKDFEAEQDKLLQNPEVRAAWLTYQSSYPHVSQYYRSARQYQNQISVVNGKKAGTDINLYKLFTEQCYNLLRPGGYCGIVIPSGIYTDLGTKQLRQMLFEQTRITGLFCFENRKEIFENVHRSFKFVVLSFEKGGQTVAFPAAFMRHEVAELQSFPRTGAQSLSVEFIRRQSPDSLSIMEMKDAREFAIVEKMLQHPLLGDDVPGKWKLKLNREFDMTNDSHLFHLERKPGMLPLYEGKMIHQFTHKWGNAKARYWVDEEDGRKGLLGREKDEGQSLDYQYYRWAFRRIARNTDERTLISTILPKDHFASESFNYAHADIERPVLLYIVSIFNSLVLDSFLRRIVSANLNMFFIYQLPIPRLTEGDRWFWALVGRAAALVCVDDSGAIWPEFAELWQSVEAHGKAFRGRPRMQLRAEIDGIVAHLYGLTEAEFVYILGTFPLVEQAHKVAAQNAWQDVRDGVIVP